MLVEKGLTQNDGVCPGDSSHGAEDVNMGKCMEALSVPAVDSRDSLGRLRFHPFYVDYHLGLNEKVFGKNYWFFEYIYEPIKYGFACCSDTPISFHYVEPNMMLTYEYFLYHLGTFKWSNQNINGTKETESKD